MARRNGGYRSFSKYEKIGFSGEDAFEKELRELLRPSFTILDAGCGHGDFTLEMAKLVKFVHAVDFAGEMIRIAESLKKERGAGNVDFLHASTSTGFPFPPGQFDLIYSRRGPTSIIEHGDLLKKGGLMMGIHSGALEKVMERLERNGFADREIREYGDSWLIFEDEREYARYLSDIPGNPDYFLDGNRGELDKLIGENRTGSIIKVREWRYIWKARKA